MDPIDVTEEHLDYIYQYFRIDPLDIPRSVMREGMIVEMEHGTAYALTDITRDDIIMTAKIVLAHLHEGIEYYDLLAELERKLKKSGHVPRFFRA